MSDEPYEPRYCEGCGEVYNMFEESHTAHDARGRYRTAITLEQAASEARAFSNAPRCAWCEAPVLSPQRADCPDPQHRAAQEALT